MTTVDNSLSLVHRGEEPKAGLVNFTTKCVIQWEVNSDPSRDLFQ